LEQVTQDYLYRKPSRAFNNLGWAYHKIGKRKEALEAYEKALRTDPQFCQVLFNVAVIHEEQEDLSRAANYLERAVTHCPAEIRYRFKLGVTLARLDRDDEALQNLEKVVTTDPSGALGIEAREYIRNLR